MIGVEAGTDNFQVGDCKRAKKWGTQLIFSCGTAALGCAVEAAGLQPRRKVDSFPLCLCVSVVKAKRPRPRAASISQ